MKPKKGQSFWDVFYDDEDHRLFWSEWVVTVIRNTQALGKIAYMVRKASWTWIKKSKKHFDYGWADNIEELDRHRAFLNDDGELEKGRFGSSLVHATRLQALKFVEASVKKRFGQVEEHVFEDGTKYTVEEQMKELKLELKAIRSAMTRMRNKKQKGKQDGNGVDGDG